MDWRRGAQHLLPILLLGAGCVFDSSGLSPGSAGSESHALADLTSDRVVSDRSREQADRPADLFSADLAADETPPDFPRAPDTLFASPSPPLTVDGHLQDWGSQGWIFLTCADWVSLAGECASTDDLSARFAARWNADWLYLAFEVTDDHHANSYSTLADLWQGDSVQVGFDVARNGGNPYDTTDDFEYGWALTGSGLATYRWYAPAGAPSPVSQYHVRRTGNRTTYEVGLAPSDLQVERFQGGMDFGFSALVNDNDGHLREGFIEWTSGIGVTKDPGQFGVLTLL